MRSGSAGDARALSAATTLRDSETDTARACESHARPPHFPMILGFMQDIVRGVRTFKQSIDSIEHSRDAKGSTNKEGQK